MLITCSFSLFFLLELYADLESICLYSILPLYFNFIFLTFLISVFYLSLLFSAIFYLLCFLFCLYFCDGFVIFFFHFICELIFSLFLLSYDFFLKLLNISLHSFLIKGIAWLSYLNFCWKTGPSLSATVEKQSIYLICFFLKIFWIVSSCFLFFSLVVYFCNSGETFFFHYSLLIFKADELLQDQFFLGVLCMERFVAIFQFSWNYYLEDPEFCIWVCLVFNFHKSMRIATMEVFHNGKSLLSLSVRKTFTNIANFYDSLFVDILLILKSKPGPEEFLPPAHASYFHCCTQGIWILHLREWPLFFFF